MRLSAGSGRFSSLVVKVLLCVAIHAVVDLGLETVVFFHLQRRTERERTPRPQKTTTGWCTWSYTPKTAKCFLSETGIHEYVDAPGEETIVLHAFHLPIRPSAARARTSH